MTLRKIGLQGYNQAHHEMNFIIPSIMPAYLGTLQVLRGIRTQETELPSLNADSFIDALHKGSMDESDDIEGKASASAKRVLDAMSSKP